MFLAISLCCQAISKSLKSENWNAVTTDWRWIIDEAIHAVQVVHEAELTRAESMFYFPIYWFLTAIERDANNPMSKQMLIDSRVPEACLFMIANEFNVGEGSWTWTLGHGAAGIAVSLISSNESGLTLNEVAINNIVAILRNCFDPKSYYSNYELNRVFVYARRVAKAVVADANKPVFVRTTGAVATLVDGLLLDSSNPKKGQDGAAELQLVCAEALQETEM